MKNLNFLIKPASGLCNMRCRSLCFGGCKRDWYTDDTGNHNYFCPAFRKFFSHAGARLAEIARLESSMRR